MIITKLLRTLKSFNHINSLQDYHFDVFIQLLPNLKQFSIKAVNQQVKNKL